MQQNLYLQIYDGSETSSENDLGKFCGNNLPVFLQSSSSDVIFNFHSDPFIQSSGFEIIWAIDGWEDVLRWNYFITLIFCRCGETLTDPSGTLTSPNYPNNYPNSKECIWQIISSPGTSVKLTINIFDVEHHQECQWSKLIFHKKFTLKPSR